MREARAESTATRDPAAALDLVVNRIDDTFAAGNYHQTIGLLHDYVLEAWFGLGPEYLLRIARTLEAAGYELPVPLAAMRSMVPPAPEAAPSDESSTRLPEEAPNGAEADDAVYSHAYVLRMHGRPVEALAVFEDILARGSTFQPLFTTHGGWGLFNNVQAGVTAMLAGDFTLAETRFTEAKLHRPAPRLPFLTRDAHSKSALLHACFGDSAVAEAELLLADQMPRTNSWVEPTLDVQDSLTRIMINPDPDETLIDQLDALPLSVIGELWPFYVYVLHTVLIRLGHPDEAARRLERLAQVPFPRVAGQGFSGSVIPWGLGFSAFVAGDLKEAREHWNQVDSNLALTKLSGAALSLAAGDTAATIRVAAEVRPLTKEFRKLELQRLSLLASCHLTLGDAESCLEVLRRALAMPRGLKPEELALFQQNVHTFASQHLPEWPCLVGPFGVAAMPVITQGAALTPREIEMIGWLAKGHSREEISNELFLSVNTVKSHQRRLYKKLGVTNRTAAVHEAEQRGLI